MLLGVVVRPTDTDDREEGPGALGSTAREDSHLSHVVQYSHPGQLLLDQPKVVNFVPKLGTIRSVIHLEEGTQVPLRLPQCPRPPGRGAGLHTGLSDQAWELPAWEGFLGGRNPLKGTGPHGKGDRVTSVQAWYSPP